jgi:predicted metal-binding membrane protein
MTPLKEACLRACRSPLAVLMSIGTAESWIDAGCD